MNKFIVISLFLSCQAIFCQDYKFDYFYEFKSTNGVLFFMLNSLDDSYIFSGRSNDNVITGSVFDFKTSVFHHYNVNNIENTVNFNYTDSRKIVEIYPNDVDEKIQFEYTTAQIDSVKESIKIVKYKQKRKRKILAEVELIYDSSNDNFIFHNSALLFLSHNFYDKREIEHFNNRLPTSIRFKNDNVKMAIINLSKKQKINTALSISKEQLIFIK